MLLEHGYQEEGCTYAPSTLYTGPRASIVVLVPWSVRETNLAYTGNIAVKSGLYGSRLLSKSPSSCLAPLPKKPPPRLSGTLGTFTTDHAAFYVFDVVVVVVVNSIMMKTRVVGLDGG